MLLLEAEHNALLAKAKAKRARAVEAEDPSASAKKAAKPRKADKAELGKSERPVCKRPAGAGGGPKGAFPAMPSGGSVAYAGGKVMPSDYKGGWRVWPDATNLKIEKLIRFGPD